MLHLAQVVKKAVVGSAGLRLLAYQRGESIWLLHPDEVMISTVEVSAFAEGHLVLVDISSTRQILSIRSATDWVLELVQKYLSTGITPAFLQQEAERAEQWRQSLTLESQELGRRTLELEARREQIEALEENLKLEKQQLESMAAQFRLSDPD